MADTALPKIFMYGRSQAVRLPLAFRLPGGPCARAPHGNRYPARTDGDGYSPLRCERTERRGDAAGSRAEVGPALRGGALIAHRGATSPGGRSARPAVSLPWGGRRRMSPIKATPADLHRLTTAPAATT